MAESWNSSVAEIVSRGKVTEVAIFQMDGTLLDTTPGCAVTEQEVRGILAAFVGPIPMFKIFIGDKLYNCQRVLHNMIFGSSEAGGMSVTALMASGTLILGFAEQTVQGSSVHELLSLERQLYTSGYLVPTDSCMSPYLSPEKATRPHHNVLV